MHFAQLGAESSDRRAGPRPCRAMLPERKHGMKVVPAGNYGVGSDTMAGTSKAMGNVELLRQASFDEFLLNICQVGFQQPAIAADIIAMGAQASQFFVDHRRHP